MCITTDQGHRRALGDAGLTARKSPISPKKCGQARWLTVVSVLTLVVAFLGWMDFEGKLEKFVETKVNAAIDKKLEVVRKEMEAFMEEELSEEFLKIRDYAKEIVVKEIEKHAADGLGTVDYAVGGRVLRHSKPYGKRSSVMPPLFISCQKEAERMISPSFGQPGHCFPLKGESGFVEIRLKAAIVPQAVTLEHVAKSVAYDRSSAPKHCRVSGWLQGQDSNKKFLLTEFTYDLEKHNAQTFKVDSSTSNLVDTIRLDFMSNHGALTYTCIYRLRVHGYIPDLAPSLEKQS